MFPPAIYPRERALGGWFCQLVTPGSPAAWACLMTNCMAELVGWVPWPQAWQNPPPRGASLSSILTFIRPNRIWSNKTFCWQKWFISKTIINYNVKFVAESALLFTIIQLQVSYRHIRLHETPFRCGFPERYLFYSKNPNRFIGPLSALEKSLDPFWNVRFTLYTH
jgi:hypothetical protein